MSERKVASVPDPVVSVVIPTYNRAHLIGESIHSVLDQTYGDFELVVVDDGSSDDTEAVVRRFHDPRIRYIYQENQGISGARNTGIRNARGKYIGFLDSDDLWLPQLLEVQVAALDADPEVGLVYAKAQAMNERGHPKTQLRGAREKYPGETLKSLLCGDFGCIQTTVVRRECFDLAGVFDETLTTSVDWDMSLRQSRVCRFHYVDRVLARFRMHPGQTTGDRSVGLAQWARDRTRVLDKAYSGQDVSPEARAVRALAYRNVYVDVGLHWLSARAWRRSAGCFWKAIQASPNPWAASVRIVWLILFWNVFSRMRWSSRLISRLVDLRRRPEEGAMPSEGSGTLTDPAPGKGETIREDL
jgi:glycosyltransferase involved in cell wall biosynthesis